GSDNREEAVPIQSLNVRRRIRARRPVIVLHVPSRQSAQWKPPVTRSCTGGSFARQSDTPIFVRVRGRLSMGSGNRAEQQGASSCNDSRLVPSRTHAAYFRIVGTGAGE